jgi:hypothetical protein
MPRMKAAVDNGDSEAETAKSLDPRMPSGQRSVISVGRSDRLTAATRWVANEGPTRVSDGYDQGLR